MKPYFISVQHLSVLRTTSILYPGEAFLLQTPLETAAICRLLLGSSFPGPRFIRLLEGKGPGIYSAQNLKSRFLRKLL